MATVRYPAIPLNSNDIYVITTEGDRLDILANQFYGDPNMYWIISRANPQQLSQSSLTIPPGTQLRIPISVDQILADYKRINNGS